MKRFRNDYLIPILILVFTAAIFFVIGYTASAIYGPAHTVTTKIEYDKEAYNAAIAAENSLYGKTTSTNAMADKSQKINLNTATLDDLLTVPGIGDTYAQRIISYRDTFGPFTDLLQLREIEGIGEKRYEQWAPYFTVS